MAEALDAVERDDLRAGIVERAHRDVVHSGAYTFESFVATVTAEIAAIAGATAAVQARSDAHAHRAARIADRLSQRWVALYLGAVGRLRPLVIRLLPERGLGWLRRRRAGRAVETASVESALKDR